MGNVLLFPFGAGRLASRPILLAGAGVALALAPMDGSTREIAKPCLNENATIAVVSRIESGGDVRLVDEEGKTLTVRLADVLSVGREGEPDEAPKTMTTLWDGRRVAIHPVAARPDRWGRTVAHIETMDTGAATTGHGDWLQADLVRRGFAMVRPEGSPAGCAAALYADERRARRSRTGLWKGSANRVLSSRDGELEKAAGTYRIVAGIVVSVGATSRRHYLNFGRDWSRDFTVTVPVAHVAAFRDAGINLADLSGRYVRVRGWLEKWNGTVITLRYPDEIEMVGKGD